MSETMSRAEIARQVLAQEAESLAKVAERAGPDIARACELILPHHGKLIVSGMGKSGYVGRKVAATLCSTGTQAVFMHPAEAVHGDLGVYMPGDPTIMLSKSGNTVELLNLIPILRSFNSPLIAILGNVDSPLARLVDVVIDASVQNEADFLNLAPTSSSTVAMAIGDSLAVTLMQANGFSSDEYARYHPGGQLGRNLKLRVGDVMQQGKDFPYVSAEETAKSVMIAMTKRPLGAACVVDTSCRLLGIITDGDLRRALLAHDDIRTLRADDIMTRQPVTITADSLVHDALNLMENRPSNISVLPVVDGDTCIGLIRIHDIYSS